MKEKRYLTVAEAAEHFGVSRGLIYKLASKNSIPGYRVGSMYRFDLDDLRKALSTGGADDHRGN